MAVTIFSKIRLPVFFFVIVCILKTTARMRKLFSSSSYTEKNKNRLVVLQKVGHTINIPYPNDQNILGVGGISYDEHSDSWALGCENIAYATEDDQMKIDASLPRMYYAFLDFDAGSIDFSHEGPVIIKPTDSLKVEDLAFVTMSSSKINSTRDGNNIFSVPLAGDYDSDKISQERSIWVVSESHSNIAETSKFFSKDYGPPDLSSYDPNTYAPSRLLRVSSVTGEVLEEVHTPDNYYWDRKYNWDSSQCAGERIFAGLHALSIVSLSSPEANNRNQDSKYDSLMFTAFQTSLYQDGNSPSFFSGSSVRILMYGLNTSNSKTSAEYLHSFRYETSQLTMKSYQKGAHFNALFGLLALNETSLLIGECEDLTTIGSGQRIANRIYFVDLINHENNIDQCTSLQECDVLSPPKKLIWERLDDEYQLDGMSWGPLMTDGRRSVALSFENDDKIGVHIELFALNEELISSSPYWSPEDTRDQLLQKRVLAVSVLSVFVALVFIFQIFFVRRLEKKSTKTSNNDGIRTSNSNSNSENQESFLRANYANYALVTAMLNSFLVGGLTFGYSGMALMLRKEGAFSDSCSCGSFCAKQKEAMAFVSTIGFAAAIGSRLFIGLFMDYQGPKLTAIVSCLVCLSGFSLLASISVMPGYEEELSNIFLPAWVLLSLGGSGLHICGFHLTNLFPGDGKKTASTCISTAFGASSAIFPIMQTLHQYANVDFVSMMKFYTAVVALITVNNFIIMPWTKLKKGQAAHYNPNLKFWYSSWWQERKLGKGPVLSEIWKDVQTFEFLGEAFAFSAMLLVLTHYLSSSSQIMYEKGDIPFTKNPNDWSDYMFSRMAGWFNALGVLWYPTVRFMVTKLTWPQSYMSLVFLNLAVIAIVFLKNLEVQIVGSVLLSFGRLLLFSCHHTYLLDTFGFQAFGTLNGISSFMAAIMGFTSYPLQLLGLQTNFAIPFLPIGLLVLVSLMFPVTLRRRMNAADELSHDCDENDLEENTTIGHTKKGLTSVHTVDVTASFHTSLDSSVQILSRMNLPGGTGKSDSSTSSSSAQPSTKVTTMNWAETVHVDTSQFRYPETTKDVVSLVQTHEKIRCAGALHSCAPLIMSEGIIMSLTKLDKILSIDCENQLVRVQAGTRIHHLCEKLAEVNLAVGTLGTIDWQTLAGAVMTGTHGGSLTIPSLHTFITSYTLVKADGTTMTVTKKDNPELFSAMAPSLGVFGVVVEMEMKVVPLCILEAKMEVIPFSDLEVVFEGVMQKNKYARVVVYPSIDKATIWTANPVNTRDEAVKRGAVNFPGYANFRNNDEKASLEEYLHFCEKGKYEAADEILHGVLHSQIKRLRHYVGQYNHVLCKERYNGIPHADIEFNFDFQKNREVLRKVRAYCDSNRVPYYNFEMRTTKEDDAMLSCCHGRDAMWIDFQAKARVSRDFFDEMEQLLKPIGFRKHWAKGMDNSDPEYVSQQFPQIKKFLNLMKDFDPKGKFRNTQGMSWYEMLESFVFST